jgi:hypothetical protein
MRAHQFDKFTEGDRLRLANKTGVVGFAEFGGFWRDDFEGSGD